MAKSDHLDRAEEWERIAHPVLLPGDSSARWFETDKIYKSHIIRDEDQLTGFPFVMYYNAKGDTATY